MLGLHPFPVDDGVAYGRCLEAHEHLVKFRNGRRRREDQRADHLGFGRSLVPSLVDEVAQLFYSFMQGPGNPLPKRGGVGFEESLCELVTDRHYCLDVELAFSYAEASFIGLAR